MIRFIKDRFPNVYWFWLFLTPVVMVVGFNCAQHGFLELDVLPKKAEVEIPFGLKTSDSLLSSMVAATGVDVGYSTASSVTEEGGVGADLSQTDPVDVEILRTYSTRVGSLPSQSDLQGTTGPMMVSVANLAITVCTKLYHQERSLGAESRRFFTEINFAAGPGDIQDDAAFRISQRMARSFWGRELEEQEWADIRQTMQVEFKSGTNLSSPIQSGHWAVGLCTAMLSSFDAVTM